MNKEKLTVSKITDQFTVTAIKYSDALQVGNYKITNKEYSRLKKIFLELSRNDVLAYEVLAPLLKHRDIRVKTWAAVNCLILKKCNVEAESVLEEISLLTDIGILSFTMEMMLKAWRENGYLTY